MKAEDVINHGGREYVSVAEFASRKGVSKQAISQMINRGKLKGEKIDGYRVIYLDYKHANAMYSHSNFVKASRKRREKKAMAEELASISSSVKEPSVSNLSIAEPEVKEERIAELIDLGTFDKERYKDCLDPATGEFDYDILKTRLTAETYKQKLDKERGTLVAKADVIDSARAIAQIVQSNLDAIPVRYTSTLIASIVSILSRKGIPCSLSEAEHTEIRVNLKKVAKEIMASVQKEIMKMMEDGE